MIRHVVQDKFLTVHHENMIQILSTCATKMSRDRQQISACLLQCVLLLLKLNCTNLVKNLAHFTFLQQMASVGRHLPLHSYNTPAMLWGKGIQKIFKLCNPGQKFGTLRLFTTNGLSWLSPPYPHPYYSSNALGQGISENRVTVERSRINKLVRIHNCAKKF